MLDDNFDLLRTPLLVVMIVVALGVNPCSLAQPQDPNQSGDFFNMSLEELMEVKVTAVSKRAEGVFSAPGIVTIITKDEIRRFGAKNLLDILGRLPGVYTTGSYMFGHNIVSVRGDLATHHNNHTLVLINGRPVRESIQGGLNYPLFTAYPIEMIERIECVRGPGSVFYGTNAFTGVINIITKGGSKPELSLTSEGGSFGYYGSTIAGGSGSDDLDFFGALHQSYEDGAHWSAIDEAGVYSSLSSREESASTAIRIESGPTTFDLFCTRQEANHFGRAPLWSLPGDEIDTKRVFADLGYNLPLNDTWRLEPHATFNYNRFVIEDGALYHQSRDVLGEITLFGEPTNRLDVVTGYIIEHLATPQSRRSSIGKYSQVALSAYGEAGYQVFENTRVITGGQWNEPEEGDGDFISRFGAIVDVTENWGIKLLSGQAFRAPWPGETLISNPVLVGNPDLKPEKIRTSDVQLFYHDPTSEVALTYFLSTMKEMIIRDTSVSPPSYRNGGEADFWGIELEGKRHLGAKLYALGSVTHQESREDSGINPSSVPNTASKLGLSYDNKEISVGVFYTYYSTPPSILGASKVNPDPGDIHWITANVNVDVTDSLDLQKETAVLTFRVENLLDQDVDHPEFNRRNINSLPVETGIAFYAGMKLLF